MPNHNHAMVNAANSMMEEYGDAMQSAIFNTAPAPRKHQLALPNPLENMSGTKKVVCGIAAALVLAHVYKRNQAGQPLFPRA